MPLAQQVPRQRSDDIASPSVNERLQDLPSVLCIIAKPKRQQSRAFFVVPSRISDLKPTLAPDKNANIAKAKLGKES
jgi:hypothetical protein